jgi:cytochrome c-type biogenesis protein CcmH/NrfG
MICSRCGLPGKPGQRFCNDCGGTLTISRTCTGCGTLIKAGAHYCPSCGTATAAGTGATPAGVSPRATGAVPPLSVHPAGTPPAAGRNKYLIIGGAAALIIVLAAVVMILPVLAPGTAPVTKNPETRHGIDTAWALNAHGKFREAAVAADTAITSDPGVADGWAQKGWALTGLGRHSEALGALDKALALDSNNAITWSNKGFALMNLGRCPEAVTSFDRAIALDPYDLGAKKYRIMAAAHCPVKP